MRAAYRFSGHGIAPSDNPTPYAATEPYSGMFAASPDLMTPADVAQVLHMTPQSVNGLCRAGRLPYVQVSERKRLIPKPALIEWIAGGGNND